MCAATGHNLSERMSEQDDFRATVEASLGWTELWRWQIDSDCIERCMLCMFWVMVIASVGATARVTANNAVRAHHTISQGRGRPQAIRWLPVSASSAQNDGWHSPRHPSDTIDSENLGLDVPALGLVCPVLTPAFPTRAPPP